MVAIGRRLFLPGRERHHLGRWLGNDYANHRVGEQAVPGGDGGERSSESQYGKVERWSSETQYGKVERWSSETWYGKVERWSSETQYGKVVSESEHSMESREMVK